MSITVRGSSFKKLINSCTKFPLVGSFAGSEQVSIWSNGKYLHTSTTGIVLSHAKLKYEEGELQPVAIDERAVSNFAGIIHPTAILSIEIEGKEIVFKSKNKIIRAPYIVGKKPIPVTADAELEGIKITGSVAKRLSYLSEIAFNDSSRAELCCVMLHKSKATSINQKVIASMNGVKVRNDVPVPLHLAKVLTVGDVLYPGVKEVILHSDCAVYSMPALTTAQKKFPFSLIQDLDKKDRKEIVVIDGMKLATALEECNQVLGSISKTEVILKIEIANSRLRLLARNAGYEFTRRVPVIKCNIEKGVYRVALTDVIHTVPFLAGKTVLSESTHGELFVSTDAGFVCFPAWIQETKKKKK